MKQILLAGLLAFGSGHLAFAALELELTDGAGDSAIIDSTGGLTLTGSAAGTASANLALGVYSYNGSIGNYVVNVSTGEGSPLLPVASLDLNSVDTSGAASGPLTIEFSENSISSVSPGWKMQWGGTLSGGAGSTVTFDAFEANSNAFFGTTNSIGSIGPQGIGVVGGTAGGAVPGVTTAYSLTEKIIIDGVGATNYSGNASLTPVPEPASVVFLGGALLAVATVLRRKWSKA